MCTSTVEFLFRGICGRPEHSIADRTNQLTNALQITLTLITNTQRAEQRVLRQRPKELCELAQISAVCRFQRVNVLALLIAMD